MSKRTHANRKGKGWNHPPMLPNARKGDIAYKDAISDTYHFEYFNRKLSKGYKKQANVRPVVEARLKKLRRYLKAAWKGYQFGTLNRVTK